MSNREPQDRGIFENSTDALFLWDANFNVVDVNPAGLELYGYTRENLIGRSYSPTLPKEYVSRRMDALRRAAGGETVHFESETFKADGTTFEAELRLMPYEHEGLPGALAVVRDIGERRRREQALASSEARLRATIQTAFDCVIGMDTAGRILEFNAAAERVFGHRREDVIGCSLADTILPERHRAAHARGLKQFLALGRGNMVGRPVDTTALRSDGTEFPVELAICVAALPEGTIFVGHVRDMTARHAAEAERAALEAQLRQAQKMEAIGQLAGGLAHDFNNILTTVIGYLAMAQERPASGEDPKLARQLVQARTAAERARDHVGQLLAFSRPRRGRRKPVNLRASAEQVLQMLLPTLSASVRANLEQTEPVVEHWAVGDPVQIEQVLFNLCINARDSIRGPGNIRLRAGHAAKGPFVCSSCRGQVGGGEWSWMEVSDDGCGMAPDVIERMFEPFFTTKESRGGTGLGLAMAHGIVHDHGGHMLVRSRPGAGSAFKVMLPAHGGRIPGATPDTAHSRSSSVGGQLQGRILLVEDDPMVADLMTELLAGFGLDVVCESDPLAAATLLESREERFDVLLTDHCMPGMNGAALAQHSARVRPSLPVVLYSGNASDIKQEELDRCSLRALLRKPIDPDALRVLLRGLLPLG